MTLAASLVVRNELSRRYLPITLTDLRRYCDQITVLDDASTDGTSEWLQEQADDQVVVTRAREASFDIHEGHTRNQLLALTLKRNPTWVLNIDADEIVDDGLALRESLKADDPAPVRTLEMAEVWTVNDTMLGVRCDGGWRPHPLPLLWRVPSPVPRGFGVADRKLACQRFPVQVRGMPSRPSVRTVLHFGWTDPSERRRRYDRYMALDKGRFHARAHLESIMAPQSKVSLRARRWPDAPWVPAMKERLA